MRTWVPYVSPVTGYYCQAWCEVSSQYMGAVVSFPSVYGNPHRAVGRMEEAVDLFSGLRMAWPINKDCGSVCRIVGLIPVSFLLHQESAAGGLALRR